MSYSSEVLADIPVAYWRAGDATTPLVDSSGNGLNATLTGTYTLGVTGLLIGDSNNAITFTSGVGTTASSSIFNNSTGKVFSIEAWIKTSTGGILGICNSDNGAGTGRWFQFRLNAGAINLILFSGGTGTGFTTAGTYNDNLTHHIVCTYDGTNVRIYVDNNLVLTTAYAWTPPNANHVVGIGNQISGGGSNPFVGTIDEVAIYFSALSAARVAVHYTLGIGGDSATPETKTSVTSVENDAFVETATVSGKTSVSSGEIYTAFGTTYTDAATVSSKTSLSSIDLEAYREIGTVTGKTTPDVIVELASQTLLYFTLSGSTYVGSTITATVDIEVTADGTVGTGSGSGGTVTSDVTYSPAGDWGFTFDDDNGLIP